MVDIANEGETVCLTRNGATVARIMAVEHERGTGQPLDIEALRRFAYTMPYQDEDAGDFVRRMRDDDSY